MTRAALALVAVLALAGPAAAMTGNGLHQQCEEGDDGTFDHAFCMGYIIGSAELFVLDAVALCMDGVTYGQVVDVVKAYLRERPEERHHPAFVLIAGALREAFDCPEGQQ